MQEIKALEIPPSNDSYNTYCSAKDAATAKHLTTELTTPSGKNGFKVATYKHKTMTQEMVGELVSYDADYCESRHLKASSRANYISAISLFGRWLHEVKGYASYKQAKEKDLREYLTGLEKAYGESYVLGWKLSTKTFYRQLLKGKTQKRDPFPKVVDWITLAFPKCKEGSLVTKRISDEEFIALDKACTDMRMKFLIHLLRETGCRVGTALSLHLKDYVSREHDVIIHFRRDKRKPYKAQIIDSVPFLRAWLEFHPYRKNPDAPLFVSTNGEAWTDDSARKAFNRLVHRAGITRRLTPHYFRHSLAFRFKMEHRSRDEANLRLNWSSRSSFYEHYGQLANEDVWNKTLAERGFVAKKEGDMLVCPRCSAKNQIDRDFCITCQFALNSKTQEIVAESHLTAANFRAMYDELQAAKLGEQKTHVAELEGRIKMLEKLIKGK